MTTITYGYWRDGLTGYPALLRELIDQYVPHSICDVGGGAAAALTVSEVEDLGVQYTLLDISADELEKSPVEYQKRLADIGRPSLADTITDRYDLIQSHMVAEHVRYPAQLHRNVFDLLRPGGIAVHLMPTLWDPAFVANRVLPEGASSKVVARLQPGRRTDDDQGKFPAYYRWCRGPSAKQVARLERIGFEIVSITGYFGTGYAAEVPVVSSLLSAATRWLIRHPKPTFTSYCVYVLRRPPAA